jgi:hypothetical protein
MVPQWKCTLVLSLLGLLCLAATAPADDPVKQPDEGCLLRYKFKPGQVLRYLVEDESTVDVTQAEASTVAKYSTKTWRHYRVRSVDAEGTASLELRIDRVHMKAEGDGKSIEFDSNRPGTPPAEFAQVTSSIGRAIASITVSANGEITAVDLREEEGAAGKNAKSREPEQKDFQVLTVLPAEPVAAGESWQEEFEVSVILEETKLRKPVRLLRRYTLNSVKDGVAEIDLETIVLTPISDPALLAQLIQRTPNGVLEVDVERGVVLSKRTRLDNQVVGFSGPGSKLKVVRTYAETLTEGETTRSAQVSAASSEGR